MIHQPHFWILFTGKNLVLLYQNNVKMYSFVTYSYSFLKGNSCLGRTYHQDFSTRWELQTSEQNKSLLLFKKKQCLHVKWRGILSVADLFMNSCSAVFRLTHRVWINGRKLCRFSWQWASWNCSSVSRGSRRCSDNERVYGVYGTF